MTSSLERTFRSVMAEVVTPVSVVRAVDGRRSHGTTVSAFASLSMSAPMVLVSLDRDSSLLRLVRRTQWLGINVLGSAQSNVAKTFARKGDDMFDGIDWLLDNGVPRIVGVASWLSCRVATLVDAGDHVVLFADVVSGDSAAMLPLTYHARAFGTHTVLESSQTDG